MEQEFESKKELFVKSFVNAQEDQKLDRGKRETQNEAPVDEISQWTILLGHDTIIPVSKILIFAKCNVIFQKYVFERSCGRVHTFCADKGRKLRGLPGSPGPSGMLE